ncbi:MAG: hypothetical protein ACI857_002946 [Arenicella sp.]
MTTSIDSAEKITDYLLREKLILEAVIQDEVRTRELVNDKIITSKKVQISSLTKALLFERINSELKEKFKGLVFTIHSMPVVYMDWERQKELIQQVTNV